MSSKKTIAIFIDQPYCSVQSANGIMRALSSYRFKIFTKEELEENFFDDVDCVCFPGGFGDADRFDNSLIYHVESVKEFVSNGGKYLGICMGAYWAGKNYFNLLNNLNTVQYIKRKNTDTKRPHAKAMNVIWNEKETKMFFYDGCSIIGNGKCEVIGKYSENNDNMAIIQNNVGIIGCHPESESSWFDNYSWMKDQYINHDKLLLDFANRLIK